MTTARNTRKPDELVKGATYSAIRGTVSGVVNATFRGRFGSELAFRLTDGSHWTVPVAYFQEAVA